MLLPPVLLRDLGELLDGDTGVFRVAEVAVDVDPIDFVRVAAPFFGSARFVSTPEGGSIGSVGVAWRLTASGVRRFEQLEEGWADLPELPAGARLMLGFAYSPDGPHSQEWAGFPSAEVVLPSAAVVVEDGVGRLVVAVPPGADASGVLTTLRDLSDPGPRSAPGLGDHSVRSIPPGTDWCAAVGEAVAAIRAGSLTKVVLARSVLVGTEMTIDPFEIVGHLGDHNPQCHLYGWQVGDGTLIGATPELLIGRRGPQVRANPLAGSAQRGEGDEEDRAVGEALMSSGKDRQEHALVVDDIADRLRSVTDELHVPEVPSLRRIATVQHLSSEITGTLSNGVSLFDLARRLHPTPAVGGTPREEAMAFIDKAEAIDRGWYSGGVGWLTPAGDGDVVIALRCGLISGRSARLYAGNGIVADSDPEDELVETRWKFLPMLNLLTVT